MKKIKSWMKQFLLRKGKTEFKKEVQIEEIQNRRREGTEKGRKDRTD